mgnify:CR=1 FL=1
MKRFIFILFLIFSLQSLTKADDIRDFQIEGMSIGDSLLEYATKEEIVKYTDSPYKSKKFVYFYKYFEGESIYEGYVAHYKKDDPKFIIVTLEGIIVFKNNIQECYALKKKIVIELDELFKNSEKSNWKKKHAADKSGKSTNVNTQYSFPSKGHIRVTCHDYSNEVGFADKLSVGIASQKFVDWIENEAYN